MWAAFWARLRGIQSNVYLPAARGVLLIGALIACLVGILGILVAGYFQTQAWQRASTPPLPPPYSEKAPKFSMDIVAARITGPGNIRFESDAGLLSSPLGKNDVIGHFLADTVNGLAPPPNDFTLLGGTDARFFTGVRGLLGARADGHPRLLGKPQAAFRYGLLASDELNDLITKTITAGKTQSQPFTVRIVAFDKFGNKSAPQDVTFTLRFGPKPPEPAKEPQAAIPEPPPPKPAEPKLEETPLTILAREIALIADPARGPAFFEAFRKASELPVACGVPKNDTAFLTNYREAFEFAKKRLTPENIMGAFLPSVCEAWRAGIAAQRTAEAEATAKRLQAMAEAQAAEAKASILRAAAQVSRNLALWVVLGAVGVLVILSLPLALLLLENHSSALRAIAEKLDANRVPSPTHTEATP